MLAVLGDDIDAGLPADEESAKAPAGEALLPSAEESAKDSAGETHLPSAEEPAKDSAGETHLPSAEELAKDSAGETHLPSAEESAKDSAGETHLPSAEEPAKDSAGETHLPSAEELAKDSAGETHLPSAEESAKDPVGEALPPQAEESDTLASDEYRKKKLGWASTLFKRTKKQRDMSFHRPGSRSHRLSQSQQEESDTVNAASSSASLDDGVAGESDSAGGAVTPAEGQVTPESNPASEPLAGDQGSANADLPPDKEAEETKPKARGSRSRLRARARATKPRAKAGDPKAEEAPQDKQEAGEDNEADAATQIISLIRSQAERLGVDPILTRSEIPPAPLTKDALITRLMDVESGQLAVLEDGTILTSDIRNSKIQALRTVMGRRGIRARLRPCMPQVMRQMQDAVSLDEEESELQASEDASSRFGAGVIDSDISRYFESLVSDALATSATDIHIETRDSRTEIKFRIDGRLLVHERTNARRALSIGYLLFNAMARRGAREFVVHKTLDAACSIIVNGVSCGLRIATAPEARGFDIMIRVLSGVQQELSMDVLGYSEMHLQLMREAINLPYGVMLMSGPVGSGKSTSLMALAREVDPVRKIISLEDPVEIVLDNVSHVPVAEHVQGASWDDLLRGLNRWDSNIVIAGEVRDQRTCAALQKMATSGRLVLSTLHAANALAIPTRMEDLGSDYSMLYDPNFLALLVNQRLVPKLCEACKRPLEEAYSDLDAVEIQRLEQMFKNSTETIYSRSPEGCSRCRSGMSGRALVCEVVKVDRIGRHFIRERDQEGWRAAIRNLGWLDMVDHAMSKIKAGILDPLIIKDLVPLLEDADAETGFNYTQRQDLLLAEHKRKVARVALADQ